MWIAKKTDAAAVRAELAEVFAERTRPDDAVLPGGCPGDDRDGARQWLRDRPWQDLLSDEILQEHRIYVHFLTPDGLAYYFPALAVLALNLDSYAELDDALMTTLARFPQRIMPVLNDRERQAVIRWLEYLADRYDERGWENSARYALETHWTAEPES